MPATNPTAAAPAPLAVAGAATASGPEPLSQPWPCQLPPPAPRLQTHKVPLAWKPWEGPFQVSSIVL